MKEFCGLEEIVFVVLFDDAKLIGIGQRAEMNRRGIHGRGDVHKFQAEYSTGKRELADVADQRDV